MTLTPVEGSKAYFETRDRIAAARERQLADALAENKRLLALLDQIKMVCDDNASVPLYGRALALQFVRDVAASAHEQNVRPQSKAGTCDGSCNEEGGPGCQC